MVYRIARTIGEFALLAAMSTFAVAAGGVIIARQHPTEAQAALKEAEKLWRRATMPWRLARLSALSPDATLLMPVYGAATEDVADTWHADRPGGRRHEGQDIFAAKGAPVFSATRGIVAKIGRNSLGGNYVLVAGAGGRRYYYAHLDTAAEGMSVGDDVSTTTVIGFVGTSGNARGGAPHLHLGVYGHGGAMNPLPFLRDR